MSLVVRDIIQMAQAQLERAGTDEAKINAELIFRHVMGVDKMGFFKLRGWRELFGGAVWGISEKDRIVSCVVLFVNDTYSDGIFLWN